MKIKIGHKVKVTNAGKHYSTYENMARKMELQNWTRGGYDIAVGSIGVVVDIRKHQDHTYAALVVGITLKNGSDHLMGEDGLEVIDILPVDMFEL